MHEQMTTEYEGLGDIERIIIKLSVLGHRKITIFMRER